MFRKTQFIFGIILLLISPEIFSQKTLKKAELQAEAGEYQKAINSYQSYIGENPDDYFAVAKLADILALTGELDKAETLYSNIPQSAAIDVVTYKNHGDLLKKMMRYEEAKSKYALLARTNPEQANLLTESVDFAIEAMAKAQSHEIMLVPSNSSSSDFGLSFYKNMPVFSSFREDILMTESEKDFNETNFSLKTFLYNTQSNRLGYIHGVNGKITGTGPVSFTKNGLKCAIIEGKVRDNYNLVRSFENSSLHIADVNDKGEIVASKPFIFNEVGSCINAACLAFEGSALYFSSNRKGGYGGFDIYVSYLNNGMWSVPKNLGATINSIGDEVTPFLDDKNLYFASDFHPGLGGFDVFKCEVIDGQWSNPENMGNGINSPSDDYFPTINKNGEFYLTSNRIGGKGMNDLYKTFKLPITEQKQEEFAIVPDAVSLDELASQVQKHTVKSDDNLSKAVSLKEHSENVVAFKLPDFDTKKVGTNSASTSLSLEGAHRIALEEMIPNTEVFFIQLASMSSVKPNFTKFKSLLKYGNIYKMMNNKTIKVRLGYFSERKEAEDILAKVRASGYKDAFIAFEVLNTAVMELILTGTDEQSFTDKGNFNTKNPDVIKEYKSANKYKVRLASYEDPIWFDVNKVKDLGRIEQWTKGGWTIFILAGYSDLEEAKKAQIQASNRGFKTSEVVIDNGGILERLRNN